MAKKQQKFRGKHYKKTGSTYNAPYVESLDTQSVGALIELDNTEQVVHFAPPIIEPEEANIMNDERKDRIEDSMLEEITSKGWMKYLNPGPNMVPRLYAIILMIGLAAGVSLSYQARQHASQVSFLTEELSKVSTVTPPLYGTIDNTNIVCTLPAVGTDTFLCWREVPK